MKKNKQENKRKCEKEHNEPTGILIEKYHLIVYSSFVYSNERLPEMVMLIQNKS